MENKQVVIRLSDWSPSTLHGMVGEEEEERIGEGVEFSYLSPALTVPRAGEGLV